MKYLLQLILHSIVWSHINDLLHHAALRIHLVVCQFQGYLFYRISTNKMNILFLPSYGL